MRGVDLKFGEMVVIDIVRIPGISNPSPKIVIDKVNEKVDNEHKKAFKVT